jgi:hypothetical protein
MATTAGQAGATLTMTEAPRQTDDDDEHFLTRRLTRQSGWLGVLLASKINVGAAREVAAVVSVALVLTVCGR